MEEQPKRSVGRPRKHDTKHCDCGGTMFYHHTTKSGTPRWRCRICGITSTFTPRGAPKRKRTAPQQ